MSPRRGAGSFTCVRPDGRRTTDCCGEFGGERRADHTVAHGSTLKQTVADSSIRKHTTVAYRQYYYQHTVSHRNIRQYTVAHRSIRRHTVAHRSIKQHTVADSAYGRHRVKRKWQHSSQGKMKLTLGNRADTPTQTAKDWSPLSSCAFPVNL